MKQFMINWKIPFSCLYSHSSFGEIAWTKGKAPTTTTAYAAPAHGSAQGLLASLCTASTFIRRVTLYVIEPFG